jgi:hypothetical protein
MASKTSFLELLLPGLGEYKDAWWQPLNDNFESIDTAIESVTTEVIDARQGKNSLLQFLQVAHENNGSLKATPEVVLARNSFLYGHRDPLTNSLLALATRLRQADDETWLARSGAASILDMLAFRERGGNMILTGSADGNGYPSWMSAGPVVTINGTSSPIWLLIDGKLSRIRTTETVTLTGAAGTKYIYAQYQAGGTVVVDGDSSTAPPASANGITSADAVPEQRVFTDVTKDFTTENVEVGDVLELLTGGDAGKYLIAEVPYNLTANQLRIKGLFPVGGLSTIDYNVIDPVGVTLGFDTSETPAAGKIYLGEADWDGVAVTAVRARHFKDVFVSEWRAVDVSGGSPTFAETFQHALGSDVLDVSVQVSQADDGTAAVEELSLSQLVSTLAHSPSNGSLSIGIGTLAVTSVGLSAGDQSVSLQPTLTGVPTLSGTVGGSLTGDVKMSRSAAVKWTKNVVNVKNLYSGVFYKDYSDVVRQTGYIRVVVRKRG